MSKRHEKLGIKQTIRLEWLQKTTRLMLAGLDAKATRQELHEFLSSKKGSGAHGIRSNNTRTFAVNNLMNIWVTPEQELVAFRDAALALLREDSSQLLAIHWGMISAAYPFWFNVAAHTGRLFALQDQVTQPQIFARLKEQYGDREVVARNTRYVIRSFAAWGILVDAENKGCYDSAKPLRISDTNVAALLFESILLATPDAKASLGSLVGSPACFPFQMPGLSGSVVTQSSERIGLARYGLDEEMLELR